MTDWHEKSANLKQQCQRFRDNPRIQRLLTELTEQSVLSEEKASNDTLVENQEPMSESAVEKPTSSYTAPVWELNTERTIIERWARHKYTTCDGSYPLAKDPHPIYY